MECGLNDTRLLGSEVYSSATWSTNAKYQSVPSRWKVAAACPRNGVFSGISVCNVLGIPLLTVVLQDSCGNFLSRPYQHTAYVSFARWPV